MNVLELLKEAHIHGVRRIASRHKWQWILLLLILAIISHVVLWTLIERYIENPTFIVQIEPTNMENQFPAVVVCPEVIFPKHRIDAFIEKLKYPEGMNETYARKVIRQLEAFFSPDVPYNIVDLINIQNIIIYNDLDIEVSGLNLTEACEETIIRCRWHGRLVECSEIFRMELTAYGFCCVFNGRSLKRDLKEFQGKNKIPDRQRYAGPGVSNALMLVINQSQATPFDVDLSYKWLSLHGGERFVDLSVNGTPITPGTELFAGYSTTGLQVDEEAVSLDKDLRRCRMSYEALKYFPIYHKTYCLMEREMEQTYERCRCLKIGHPRLPGVPVCRAQSLQCARQTTVSFGELDDICPVACDAEVEHLTLSSYDLQQNSSPYDSFYKDLDLNKVSVVRVFVLKHRRKIFSRRPYFTRFELFAQLGGIFNVFFGCSVLSILEMSIILYHGIRPRILLKIDTKKRSTNQTTN